MSATPSYFGIMPERDCCKRYGRGAHANLVTAGSGEGPTPQPGPDGSMRTTLRLIGDVPPEIWNRLGHESPPEASCRGRSSRIRIRPPLANSISMTPVRSADEDPVRSGNDVVLTFGRNAMRLQRLAQHRSPRRSIGYYSASAPIASSSSALTFAAATRARFNSNSLAKASSSEISEGQP